MSMRGLHVLTGGMFVHEYPGQCADCTHREPPLFRDISWPFCHAKAKKICCEKGTAKRKCKDFVARSLKPSGIP